MHIVYDGGFICAEQHQIAGLCLGQRRKERPGIQKFRDDGIELAVSRDLQPGKALGPKTPGGFSERIDSTPRDARRRL